MTPQTPAPPPTLYAPGPDLYVPPPDLRAPRPVLPVSPPDPSVPFPDPSVPAAEPPLRPGAVLLRPSPLPPLPSAPVLPPGPREARPQLWLVATEVHEDSAARYASLVLDAEELARAGEFRRPGDRATYLCAHVGLRRLLGAHLGVAPRGVTMERAPCPCCGEPHGRPVLPDGRLHFSLSHCEGMSLIAVATTPVGVDIERIPAPHLVAELAEVLHPAESAELAALARDRRPAAFARVWTRKEAYLKGTGVGLGADPSAEYVGSGPVPTAPPGWLLADVAVPSGHQAAVAVRR
ncbi:4'-phosphopantetheinyl transferase superfamily protein [Streptomyces sp. NBC_00094]|uniref:4'-phosphopantetheinyl transferase family protein n=1 Tax=Streptomyces sp. NBC_00094 TaxID=2903620 RepID=UPI002250B3C5|nr:4'-phosphopantetheinyl transferase superfamily protein [Streptomyces sp. NBC_00094]MCX5394699.1 4'-phosphopantetheinyl transferase superfamily protein [Streptomyces sp. NBC_00094]